MTLFKGVRRASFISLGLVAVAAVGFGYKIFEFINSLDDAAAAGFAIVPLSSYFLSGFGFLMLLIWSITRGDFQDIEKPKYKMIRREMDYAAEEGDDLSEWSEE